MMSVTILFSTLFLLLILSVPMAAAIGLATLVSIMYADTITLSSYVDNLTSNTDNFPLLAVPFFILAGDIMAKGGITKRLFKLTNAMVGGFTGGFAIATIVMCMFFGALTGSSLATVAAIGAIMVPEMVKQGYDKLFATATVAAAGTIGVIIPPSIPFIIYGVAAETSVGDMFIAGIIPGILFGLLLMVWAYIYSK